MSSSADQLFAPQEHVGHNFHCRVGRPPRDFVPDFASVGPASVEEPAEDLAEAVEHAFQLTRVKKEEEEDAEEEEQPARDQPVSVHGYPAPGPQSPKTTSVMKNNYFVNDKKWANLRDLNSCDYVVIGSGCTALAFIDEALRLDPFKRILCLERGDYLHPSHFQNLPLPLNLTLGGETETFPFRLSRKTVDTPELKYCHGSCPFFGGRSSFWSAWCPQPTKALMRDYPSSLINTAYPSSGSKTFWKRAHEILNVTSVKNIRDGAYGHLQDVISDKRLPQSKISKLVPSADISEPAPLAVGAASKTSRLRFNKLSTVGPLLALVDRQRKAAMESPPKGSSFMIRINAVAQLMDLDDDDPTYVSKIMTKDKVLSWDKPKETKVILCAGAFPNATMLLNSIQSTRKTIGKRLTGHFLTHIVARVPISVFGSWTGCDTRTDFELAAQYVAGKHPKTGRQYHVQITAIHSPNPEQDAIDAARECPDYAAAATREQLKGSEKHVVFVCATLGEFTENNPDSFVRRDPKNPDPTTNIFLQYTLADDDTRLWDLMDEATYQTIEAMATSASALEYWDEGRKGWIKAKPDTEYIRVPGIVHEASVSYVGDKEKGGTLDSLYRPHGIKNVFVTGAGILPTAGSWNPTMTICGYAQDLARRLHNGEGDK